MAIPREEVKGQGSSGPQNAVPQIPLAAPGLDAAKAGTAFEMRSQRNVLAEPELHTRQLGQLQLVALRFRRHRLAMIGFVLLLLIILSAIFAPLLTPENPYDPLTYDPANATIAPTLHNWDFILGTDVNGHSILSQILWGGRVSLTVGIVSALVS